MTELDDMFMQITDGAKADELNVGNRNIKAKELREITERSPFGVYQIFNECGCRAFVDLIEMKARIEYCPKHDLPTEKILHQNRELISACSSLIKALDIYTSGDQDKALKRLIETAKAEISRLEGQYSDRTQS